MRMEPRAPDAALERERLLGGLLEVETRLNTLVVGQEALVRSCLIGVLARGHILLEGLPGLGKTRLALALAGLCDLSFRRIQFTPDLMPLDILGTHILEEGTDGRGRSLRFRPGPVFSHLVLADEINRAGPKTQSALLEAMQERRVTVLGETHGLPEPFLVVATQNPIELEGTYPLPEAQLDRFLFKLRVPEVPAEVLTRLVTEFGRGDLPPLQPVLARTELLAAMEVVARIPVSRPVADYIARLVEATRPARAGADRVKYGASPRAALAMAMAARARAFLDGRLTVGFEDVEAVAPPVLRHRIVLAYQARLDGLDADQVVASLVQTVPRLAKHTPETVVERLV